jgi:hypothetical protein
MSTIDIKGHVEFKHTLEDGTIEFHKYDNMIVDAGKLWILNRIAQATVVETHVTRIKVGSNGAAPAATGQTALLTQTGDYAASVVVAPGTITWTANLDAHTSNILEAGLFTVTSNKMIARLSQGGSPALFITKGAGGLLEINWVFTLA